MAGQSVQLVALFIVRTVFSSTTRKCPVATELPQCSNMDEASMSMFHCDELKYGPTCRVNSSIMYPGDLRRFHKISTEKRGVFRIRGGGEQKGDTRIFGLRVPTPSFSLDFGLGMFSKPKQKSVPSERSRKWTLNDTSKAVMIQGFDWASMPDKAQLYASLAKEIPAISEAAINIIWFPPPSSSADPHGYMPGRWYDIPHQLLLKHAIDLASAEGIIGMVDVVLNHRAATRVSNVTGDWTSFESPDWEEWAVVQSDWKCPPYQNTAFCPSHVSSCGAADTGENACFAADLDHTNSRVQNDIIAWLSWLRDELGFRALRFDNTKGYQAAAVARYVSATRPIFSVGEFFDTNRDLLTDWLRRSGGEVGNFDFGLRYKLKDSIKDDDYSPLRDDFFGPMLHYAPGSSVTFLDNHDTAGELHDRFGSPEALEMGYVFLLSHPGVPCVFWVDWLGPLRPIIRQLSQLRLAAGITSVSKWDLVEAGPGLYAGRVGDALAVKLGTRSWSPNHGLPQRSWQSVASGVNWAMWTRIRQP